MFSGLKNAFGSAVKKTGATLTSVILDPESIAVEQEEETPEESIGCLWEDSDHVTTCRHCLEDFSMPLIKRKHHCRRCGGTFCDDCARKPEEVPKPTAKTKHKKKSSSSSTAGKPNGRENERWCIGCQRGETPGEQIQYIVRAQLEKAQKRKTAKEAGDELGQVMKKVQKGLSKVANQIGIQIVESPPSISLALIRGKMYDNKLVVKENNNNKKKKKNKKGKNSPPTSGYFEFTNKHNTMCAIKVLFPGGDKKFEIPRPSYFAVPPGETVSGEFDASSTEHIELILLHDHPVPIEKDSHLVFDTREEGVTASDISTCAKIDLFREVTYFTIPCENKNVLLKYKGGDSVLPRNGNSLERVGFFNWIAGRRYAEGMIDYTSNINFLDIDFNISTS